MINFIKSFAIFGCFFAMQTSTAQTIKIDITSPIASQNFKKGDTVFLKGSVVSNGPLHDVFSEIYDNADSSMIYFTKNYHTHGASQTINLIFVIPTDEEKVFCFNINTKDHGNQITSQRKVIFMANKPAEKGKQKGKKRKAKR